MRSAGNVNRLLMNRRTVKRALLLVILGNLLSVIAIVGFNAFCDVLISNFSTSDVVVVDAARPTAVTERDAGEWSSGRLFPEDRPFVLLSINYHASPISDVQDLLEPLGVRFIQKDIMAYGCQHFNSCRTTGNFFKDLVVSKAFHWLMNYKWTQAFYEKYRDDADWRSADAFICFHPSATCELFVPFNKPVIVLSTIRVDNGRLFPGERRRWIETLTSLVARNQSNVVAANNRYDVAYTRYFTGIEALLLPSYCGYTNSTYRPTRPGFLLGPRTRSLRFLNYFVEQWSKATKALNITDVRLTPVNAVYPGKYGWRDLAAHQGIVNLPIQPSMMSIFEQYRMNIPLFFPSHRLLVDWQMEYNIMDEINLYGPLGVLFEPHPTQAGVPSPNRRSRESLEHWLRLCDWYQQLPHVVLYDSFEHLAVTLHRLSGDELLAISRTMAAYNRRFKAQLLSDWRDVLFRVAGRISNRLPSRNATADAAAAARK